MHAIDGKNLPKHSALNTKLRLQGRRNLQAVLEGSECPCSLSLHQASTLRGLKENICIHQVILNIKNKLKGDMRDKALQNNEVPRFSQHNLADSLH